MKNGILNHLQQISLIALMGISVTLSAKAESFGFDVNEIVGGTTVKSSDPVAASTVLLLAKPSSGEYLCTGSLIAQDIIVTAAHCVAAAASEIQIVFGLSIDSNSWNPTSSDVVMPITGYLANPHYQGENFQGNDMGDIAIIHINRPLPAGFRPAVVLPSSISLSPGQPTLLAGYGITSGITQKGAGTLRQVTVPILDSVGSTEESIDESHRKGSCSGDSGGPAFVQSGGQLYLWGVTSRGDQNCQREGIYTRINTYSAWINQAAAQLRR